MFVPGTTRPHEWSISYRPHWLFRSQPCSQWRGCSWSHLSMRSRCLQPNSSGSSRPAQSTPRLSPPPISSSMGQGRSSRMSNLRSLRSIESSCPLSKARLRQGSFKMSWRWLRPCKRWRLLSWGRMRECARQRPWGNTWGGERSLRLLSLHLLFQRLCAPFECFPF